MQTASHLAPDAPVVITVLLPVGPTEGSVIESLLIGSVYWTQKQREPLGSPTHTGLEDNENAQRRPPGRRPPPSTDHPQ